MLVCGRSVVLGQFRVRNLQRYVGFFIKRRLRDVLNLFSRRAGSWSGWGLRAGFWEPRGPHHLAHFGFNIGNIAFRDRFAGALRVSLSAHFGCQFGRIAVPFVWFAFDSRGAQNVEWFGREG